MSQKEKLMGKIIDRYRQRAEKPQTDWKDSRIVIAALSVAGTATFMSTVVVPVTTAALTAKLEALAPADEKIRRLEKELAENKAALAVAKTLVAEATVKTPFLPGSVYPVGLDRIHIGSTREQVVEAYPNGNWTDDDYVSVPTDHKLFSQITYYFDGDKKNRHVSMILFHPQLDAPLNHEAIKNRVAILFGPPTATGRRGQTWWKATARESIEMDPPNSYTVKAANNIPFWVNR